MEVKTYFVSSPLELFFTNRDTEASLLKSHIFSYGIILVPQEGIPAYATVQQDTSRAGAIWI